MKPGVDYIGTSAGCVVFDKDGKVFMAKRSQGARDDVGKWEFPGGTILFSETREQAAKRNMRDKHNIEVGIESVLGIYDVIDEDFGDHRISTTYIAKYKTGDPQICFAEKCEEIGWFEIEQIKNMNLSRITRLNLDDILHSRKGI